MFPKELLGEGAGSVYLFLMKPAVALMAGISNRSPSLTEENNKQQLTFTPVLTCTCTKSQSLRDLLSQRITGRLYFLSMYLLLYSNLAVDYVTARTGKIGTFLFLFFNYAVLWSLVINVAHSFAVVPKPSVFTH